MKHITRRLRSFANRLCGIKTLTKKYNYSGFKICKKLKPNEKCFRLQKYNKGEVDELFHEHIPKHRISSDNSDAFMKSLIIKYSELTDSRILKTYFNNKGKEPSSISICQSHVEYPEPGVLRKYFSGGNTTVWVDEVISPNDFQLNDGKGQ